MVVALDRVDGVGIPAVFLAEPDCCGGSRFNGHESESILAGNCVDLGGIDCLRHRVLTPAVWYLRDSSKKLQSLKTALAELSCKSLSMRIGLTLLPVTRSRDHIQCRNCYLLQETHTSESLFPCGTCRHCGL